MSHLLLIAIRVSGQPSATVCDQNVRFATLESRPSRLLKECFRRAKTGRFRRDEAADTPRHSSGTNARKRSILATLSTFSTAHEVAAEATVLQPK